MEIRFDTNRMNKATSHVTGVLMDEEFMRVCGTGDVVKCVNKCVISNTPVAAEDDVLLEESGSLDTNSNGECDKSGGNCKRFCYK